MAAWRKRPLGEIVYLFLDARYEKVRQDGQIRDAAILIASGVDRARQTAYLGRFRFAQRAGSALARLFAEFDRPRPGWGAAHRQR